MQELIVGINRQTSEVYPTSEVFYNYHKIIATDMGLGKPWDEPGKEDPDSLIAVQRRVIKRMQDSLKAKA